jgi:hypothetical protein
LQENDFSWGFHLCFSWCFRDFLSASSVLIKLKLPSDHTDV